MVTITDFVTRRNLTTGENFYAFVLQGDLEIVTSESGRKYATTRRTTIPCTFEQVTEIERYIGKQLPGAIEKVTCDPYKYTIPESGKEVTLDYTWEYNEKPVQVSMEEHVFQGPGNGVPG